MLITKSNPYEATEQNKETRIALRCVKLFLMLSSTMNNDIIMFFEVTMTLFDSISCTIIPFRYERFIRKIPAS